MKINKKHIEFLKEYENLCKKYNMGLHGCGCCGSPFLIDCSGEKCQCVDELENINFNEDGEITIEPGGKCELKLKDFIKSLETSGDKEVNDNDLCIIPPEVLKDDNYYETLDCGDR